jgi:hypothetical protein
MRIKRDQRQLSAVPPKWLGLDLPFWCSCRANCSVPARFNIYYSQDSSRNAAIGTVLNEEAAIYLSLLDSALLITAVHDVRSSCWLLQHSDLVLAISRVVIRDCAGHSSERGVSNRVVHFEGAGIAGQYIHLYNNSRSHLALWSIVMAKFCQLV